MAHRFTALTITIMAITLLGGAPSAVAAGPGATFLVSQPTGFGALPQAADGPAESLRHAISDDGRFTVFDSSASDLGPHDGRQHVYVRDDDNGTTTLLDRAGPSGAIGNSDADSAAISDDGSTVCFDSSSTNLVAGVTDGLSHVYVVSLSGDSPTSIVVADRSSMGALGNRPVFNACSLDQDGSHVAFEDSASNLVSGISSTSTTHVYLRDLGGGTTTLVDESGGTPTSSGAQDPSLAKNGSGDDDVAFVTEDALDAATDTNSLIDVYVRNVTANNAAILVSRADGSSGAVGNAASSDPSLAIAGGAVQVAFQSQASNLGDDDTGSQTQIHVRNATAHTTTLVSRNDGAGGAIGNALSSTPAISSDGTVIAFESEASNWGLTPPTNGSEVWVRNLSTNGTAAASRASGSGGTPDDSSASEPSIDGDGGVVVWNSQADNLDPNANGEFPEVFRRSRTSPFATTVESRPSGTGPRSSAVDASFSDDGREISADGRFVVIESASDVLDPAGASRDGQVYLRDNLTGATTLVSRAAGPAGALGDGVSGAPAISADGTKIAFVSEADNLIPGVSGTQVYERDVATGAMTLVSRVDGVAGAPASSLQFDAPSLSADGSKVTFTTASQLTTSDTNGKSDVYVRDVNAGTSVVASIAAAGGLGDGQSNSGSISADGTRVAFLSSSTNLVPDESDGDEHAYVRDLAAGTTTEVDRQASGAPPPSSSQVSSVEISASGTRVAFSDSSPLTPDSGAAFDQSYVRDLAAGTTTLVSRADGAAGAPIGAFDFGAALINDIGQTTQISYDGSTVEFAGGPNPGGPVQSYVRNLAAGTTTLVSAVDGSPGVAADTSAGPGGLDVDGSCAIFNTQADNLTALNYGSEAFDQIYAHVVSRECPLVAPDTTIDSAPSTTLHVPTASFAYHSSEAGSTFGCQLDDGAVSPCGATFTTPKLSDGVHRFAVAATDAAGNTDPTPALATFTVEVAPSLSSVSVTHAKFKDGTSKTATSASVHTARKKKAKTPSGTSFRFTVSETSSLKIEIDKVSKGRRKTSKSTSSCVKSTSKVRKHKSCTRLTEVVTLKRKTETAGKHSLSFSGRWSTHKLADGSYEAKLTATDPSGNHSTTKTVKFTVVKH